MDEDTFNKALLELAVETYKSLELADEKRAEKLKVLHKYVAGLPSEYLAEYARRTTPKEDS